MEKTHPTYNSLKLAYSSLLSKKGMEKGRMRTFIGLSTWIHEQKLTGSDLDGITSHTYSFEAALEEASIITSNAILKEKIASFKGRWLTRPDVSKREPISKEILEPPIKKIRSWKGNGLNGISLFSGAMGLDLGFLRAGFDIRVANDIDPWSRDTIRRNLPDLRFIDGNIDNVTTKELLDAASISADDVDVLIGGPPCQPFSPAGKRLALSDPRVSPLKYFIRAIREIKPRAFVMEEVPGILSSRLKHFPISERGKRQPTEEEEGGSAFRVISNMLSSTGYKLIYDKLNAADYGSPQVRKRIIFIGLRDSEPEILRPTHSNNGAHGTLPWRSFWEATADIEPIENDYVKLSDSARKYMRYVPPGGNWRELPDNLIEEAMGGAYYAGGGKMGFYRRLAWDEPLPTVVTTPNQKGTMFVHPEYERMISVKEYGRVQGFPDDWEIAGSKSDKYRLIGNAVPVHLSYAVAKHLRKLLERESVEPRRSMYAYK